MGRRQGRACSRESAGFHRARPDRGHAQAVELCERRTPFDNVYFGVSAHLDQAELMDLPSSDLPRESDPFGKV